MLQHYTATTLGFVRDRGQNNSDMEFHYNFGDIN